MSNEENKSKGVVTPQFTGPKDVVEANKVSMAGHEFTDDLYDDGYDHGTHQAVEDYYGYDSAEPDMQDTSGYDESCDQDEYNDYNEYGEKVDANADSTHNPVIDDYSALYDKPEGAVDVPPAEQKSAAPKSWKAPVAAVRPADAVKVEAQSPAAAAPYLGAPPARKKSTVSAKGFTSNPMRALAAKTTPKSRVAKLTGGQITGDRPDAASGGYKAFVL